MTSIEAKLQQKVRLTLEEGLSLYDLPLGTLAQWADGIKSAKYGDRVTFIKNYYLNFTNICRYACKYCGFRRNKGDADAYTLTLEQVVHKLQSAPEAIREVWFSSGLNPELPFQAYIDLIHTVKRTVPRAQLKAFTAVEIDFIAKQFQYTHEYVLDRFIEAGLDRIPGGGAEIFDDEVRKKIDIKTRPEDYLRIHGLCHERDMQTSITMLFGHIETRKHRIAHMLRIREFQDKSKGVQAFIPLAYQDENNPLAKRGVRGPHPVEVLKTLAISRIMLDNVDHIQSFWIDSGAEVTQISLHMGVDDINGTMIEENIAHASGSKAKTYETTQALMQWIEGAGKVPAERGCRFEILENEVRVGS